jgi:hypothetical protein
MPGRSPAIVLDPPSPSDCMILPASFTPGDFNMLEQTSPTDRSNVPGTREVLH